jgi:hypothetical protein
MVFALGRRRGRIAFVRRRGRRSTAEHREGDRLPAVREGPGPAECGDNRHGTAGGGPNTAVCNLCTTGLFEEFTARDSF